jgi:hypothetical protein
MFEDHPQITARQKVIEGRVRVPAPGKTVSQSAEKRYTDGREQSHQGQRHQQLEERKPLVRSPPGR